jgi:hypothetical protein
MKIGFSVEGSTDRAVLTGLRDRWCPSVTLVPGRFRGSTKQSLRREFQRTCDELLLAGVDVIVFLTDAGAADWREVQANERAKLPKECLHCLLLGVPDQNIESWLCADAEWLASKLGGSPDLLRSKDPKRAFEQAVGIDRDDRRENEIAALIREAPLRRWLANGSFADFYEQARDLSQQLGCSVENLRNPTPG